jgi:hypothetical protein
MTLLYHTRRSNGFSRYTRGRYGTGHLTFWITHYLHPILFGTRSASTNIMARTLSAFSMNRGLVIGGGISKYVIIMFDICVYILMCSNCVYVIQSRLPPNLDGAAPFCFILYADKTKLSSHGTMKGYPVMARCANLPVDIQNGEGIGGGWVVGWLPIVSQRSSVIPFDNANNIADR